MCIYHPFPRFSYEEVTWWQFGQSNVSAFVYAYKCLENVPFYSAWKLGKRPILFCVEIWERFALMGMLSNPSVHLRKSSVLLISDLCNQHITPSLWSPQMCIYMYQWCNICRINLDIIKTFCTPKKESCTTGTYQTCVITISPLVFELHKCASTNDVIHYNP
jgi:hypothetical protein